MEKRKVLKIFDEQTLLQVLNYILLAGLYYVLGCGQINSNKVNPFAFGLLFALILIKKRNYPACMLYLLGNSLAGFSLNSLYSTLFVTAVALVTVLLQNFKKNIVNIYSIYAFAGASQVLFVLLNRTNNKLLLSSLLGVVLGLMFMFCCIVFLKGTLGRNYNIKLNLDEIVCGCIMLAVLSMCFTFIDGGHFEFVKAFATLSILLFTYTMSPSAVFLVSALCGIGYALSSLNMVLISVFVCYALLALAFKTSYKLLSVLGIVLGEIAFGLFFKVYGYFGYESVLSVLCGGVIFLCLPNRLLNYIKAILGGANDKYAIRSLVNRTKKGICKRMNELSAVFEEMKNVYNGMIKGVLSFDDAKTLLITEITEKLCNSCPERNKCLRVNGEVTMDVFDDLIERGFERGKVTLLDVPQYLSTRCGKINNLLSTFNSVLKSYKNYSNIVGNMDASRMLIGEQLGGVSSVLKKLAEEINLNIAFDVERENLIMEELSYVNVGCREVIVYDENTNNKSVTLLVGGEYKAESIEKIVSKICKCKMKITNTVPSEIAGLQLIQLKNKPNFDIVFGSSSCSKQGVFKNGDAHSLVKLQNGKYLLALCDGMGSGEKAKALSNLTITLIENFYKAGFDNDTILSSINKLLCLNNEENFSSVDLCVMDLHTNLCDIIKMGSTYGIIKHLDGCEIVEGSNLPVGILEESKPHIVKKVLNEFDIILLFSDGITDAFKTSDELLNFIACDNTINVQTLSENILDRAIDLNNGEIKDDMTVVAVRVFPT